MFEDRTYESILKEMLGKVSGKFDKREGSIIYDALAPAALELAQLYADLNSMIDQMFADTANREYLIRRAMERRLSPYGSSPSVVRGVFNVEVGEGARFSLEDVNFSTIEYEGVQEETGYFIYKMECEESGRRGNITGNLIPIENISGLTYARAEEILKYGEDEEDTESFRKRYFDSINNIAFGGNVADYRQKVGAMEGVGGVKVYRADDWLGAGTVKVVITTSENTAPSEELISRVKEALDPSDMEGKGMGLAPIGHIVTVEGARSTSIDISISVKTDGSELNIKDNITAAIKDYIEHLNIQWEEEERFVIYISQIIGKAVEVKGVVDVISVTVNGSSENYEMEDDCIAVAGNITVEEV